MFYRLRLGVEVVYRYIVLVTLPNGVTLLIWGVYTTSKHGPREGVEVIIETASICFHFQMGKVA